MTFSWNDRKILINMITCMEMSVFLKQKFILFLFIKFDFFRMINNLISHPMKQIWINLELYYKIYEFF